MVKSLTKRFHVVSIFAEYQRDTRWSVFRVCSELKQFHALFVRVVNFFCVKTCRLYKII